MPGRVSIYVAIHGKTNHIALGLNLRYEPNKSPIVIRPYQFDVCFSNNQELETESGGRHGNITN